MARKAIRPPVEYVIDDEGQRVPLFTLSKWEREELQSEQDMDDAGDLFASGGDSDE